MIAFLVQETIRRDIDDLDQRATDVFACLARCYVTWIACNPNNVHVIIHRDLLYQHAGPRGIMVPAEFFLDGKPALSIESYHEIVVTDAKTYAPYPLHATVLHDLEIIRWWPHHAVFPLGGIFHLDRDINLAIREHRIFFKNEFWHGSSFSQSIQGR